MVLTQEKKKEMLNMILRKTATGTLLGLGFATVFFLMKQKSLAAIAMGYTIGIYLQDANQELVKKINRS
jgi:hypothetical protein